MIVRFLMLGFLILAVVLLLLQVKVIDRRFGLPAWYKQDPIAAAHRTGIIVRDTGVGWSNPSQLEKLKQDYGHLWAHLNHLWATGDVEAGKEYYTEDWFTNLCTRNPQLLATGADRQDLHHELYISDWSADGLVCNLIDSNLILQYTYHLASGADSIVQCREQIAFALLLQGDYWRIDGIRQIASANLSVVLTASAPTLPQ